MTIYDGCPICGLWLKDCRGHATIGPPRVPFVYDIDVEGNPVPKPLGAPNTVDMIVQPEAKREIRFPHCDARIMHIPGVCTFCDASGLQEVRACWGKAYTGQEPEGDQAPCPANEARSDESLYSWGGNRPQPPKEEV